MFAHAFFPARFFTARYFPGEFVPGAIKPRYFYHGYFSAVYYPDGYFPGNVAVTPTPVQPPGVISGGGSADRGVYVFPITGLADLVLPALACQGLGLLTPSDIRVVDGALVLSPLAVAALGWVASAPVGGMGSVTLPLLGLSGDGRLRRPTVDRAQAEAEENALLEHYLLSLKDES